MKKHTILTSILIILMCLSVTIGGTFALFTTESKVNLAISLGKVDVYAYVDEEPTLSSTYGSNVPETKVIYDETTNKIDVLNMIPGDKVDFSISIIDRSTVSAQYQTSLKVLDNNGNIYTGLTLDIDGLILKNTGEAQTDFMPIPDVTDGEVFYTVPISVYMPENTVMTDVTNISLVFSVIAVQGNIYTGPQATVNEISSQYLPTYSKSSMIILEGNGGDDVWAPAPDTAIVESAYTFTANQTYEEAINSNFSNWFCDFIIETDKEIEVGELGLIGSFADYEDGSWLGFTNPIKLSVGDKLPLIVYAATNMGFPDLLDNVWYPNICAIKNFHCGLFRANDSVLDGTTVTVSLVIANPQSVIERFGYEEAAYVVDNYIMNVDMFVVNKTSYTFE